MIYAPVIIPTLHRHEHFKACLTALESCTDAEHTEVYVALDYPPSDPYVEGWKMTDDYLKDKERAHGFKSLTVFRRETNYHLVGKQTGKGNVHVAIEDVLKNHDRYIVLEDDCICSPNLLEYLNKGLERFKDDPTVLAINAYTPPLAYHRKDNTFFRQNVGYYAWGLGMWADKRKVAEEYIVNNQFADTFSLKNARRMWNNGRTIFHHYLCISNRKKRLPYLDVTISLYMGVNQLDVVMPFKSLVRNMGWDGSGVNCNYGDEAYQLHASQDIDSDAHFDFVGTGREEYERNHRLFVDKSLPVQTSWFTVLKTCVWFIISRTIHQLMGHHHQETT